jgi:O-antigen/teichoic acid export membrane protein
MAKLGIFMTLSGFIASASRYILSAYISNRGGVEQIGLYNAGWGVVAQYTGLIFTAMSTDYYPRLSAINQNIEKVKLLVKQQAETALFLMTPLLALLIITMPLVIKLFYTSAFIPIVLFANLTVLGMPLKAVSWSLGYIYLAKGDGRLFFTIELIIGLAVLILNLVGYYFFGLEGLGYSFILTFIIGIAVSYPILKMRYNFRLPLSFLRTFMIIYLFCIASFLTSLFHKSEIKYGSGLIVLILATVNSLQRLNKVMDFKSILKTLFKG